MAVKQVTEVVIKSEGDAVWRGYAYGKLWLELDGLLWDIYAELFFFFSPPPLITFHISANLRFSDGEDRNSH